MADKTREVISLPICVVKVWREMGPFSIHIETGGYTSMGMFLMLFSNMGTIFSNQMNQQHVYIS